MIKRIFTPATIAVHFWGIGLLIINEYYYEYLRFYLYVSILLIIPIALWNLVQKRKKDTVEETQEFKSSIYRMLFMAIVMIVIFFITRQNHI
ncbi:hypothetical protein SAMN06265220_1011195 [Flavobacterium nitrogenifigens]|uniref:Uncharacterized protein n=1 Tax=Flavobacterium nitrogenifigens TaxID=1617283 RepID=A0A521BPF2_9FLAO|nr:hypothetical protein SAMN06265220_1011195 [Flavobacterium nitrogenifigens]